MIHRNLFIAVSLALLMGTANADVIHLKKGGRLEGVLISEGPTSVTLDVGMGRVSLPLTSVLRIERGASALSEFRRRLAAMQSDDLRSYIELARFASDAGLRSEAKIAWARVSALDPTNAEAHQALGHVLVSGRYVDEEEAYRERGYIQFEGRWMTPVEQASLLREREDRRSEDRRLAEAVRAAREADDRARRTEAEAARSRAAYANNNLFPYGSSLIYGSPVWGGYPSGCGRIPCRNLRPVWHAPAPAPVATPLPHVAPVRPSSIH